MNRRLIILAVTLLIIISSLLIASQTFYMRSMYRMRSQIFYSYLHSALEEMSRSVEEQEIRQHLLNGLDARNFQFDDEQLNDSLFLFLTQTPQTRQRCYSEGFCGPWFYDRNRQPSSQVPSSIRQKYLLFDAYFKYSHLVDEIVLQDLMSLNTMPIEERIDLNFIVETLRKTLKRYNIGTPFALRITDPANQKSYTYGEFEQVYSKNHILLAHTLYQGQRPGSQATSPYVEVTFPYIETLISPSRFLFPSIASTTLFIVLFIISMIILFRERNFALGRQSFTRNMTHELKTPVSSIRLAGEMLSDPSINLPPETRNKLLSVISSETQRLSLLIEKVLIFSVIDQRKMNLSPVDLNVDDILLKVRNTFAFRVEELGGTLETRLECKNALIKGDNLHFQNVVFNLLDNAVKYSKPNTPLHIIIQTKKHKDRINISVQDNGIGIPKDELGKIFDQYYRVQTGNKHDIKGFGLGLAYVARIVQSMNGKIKTKSTPGEGTEMILDFPLLSTE